MIPKCPRCDAELSPAQVGNLLASLSTKKSPGRPLTVRVCPECGQYTGPVWKHRAQHHPKRRKRTQK
jgi:hypothetical protein